MSLKGKKVLITAGPTWVALDKVRVISNIASGETGILLSEKLLSSGAEVTLLLGPGTGNCTNQRIRIINYRFFEELKDIIKSQLSCRRYDIVVHSAAVSDYRPKKTYFKKVKSDKRRWDIELEPTPKIIQGIKKIDNSLFLLGFKFEPEAKKASLLKSAARLFHTAQVDLVVANTILRNHYRAYILSKEFVLGPFSNKKLLVSALTRQLDVR